MNEEVPCNGEDTIQWRGEQVNRKKRNRVIGPSGLDPSTLHVSTIAPERRAHLRYLPQAVLLRALRRARRKRYVRALYLALALGDAGQPAEREPVTDGCDISRIEHVILRLRAFPQSPSPTPEGDKSLSSGKLSSPSGSDMDSSCRLRLTTTAVRQHLGCAPLSLFED
jgi:hypothetical protein